MVFLIDSQFNVLVGTHKEFLLDSDVLHDLYPSFYKIPTICNGMDTAILKFIDLYEYAKIKYDAFYNYDNVPQEFENWNPASRYFYLIKQRYGVDINLKLLARYYSEPIEPIPNYALKFDYFSLQSNFKLSNVNNVILQPFVIPRELILFPTEDKKRIFFDSLERSNIVKFVS